MGSEGTGRQTLIVTFLVVGAVVGGVVGSGGGPPEAVAPSPLVTEAPVALEVHVAGWVVRPGVVTVEDGAIVATAIAAAGGLKPGASTDRINLAAVVRDGDQIVVPGPTPTGGDGSEAGGPVPLNSADAAAFEQLPGVGPVLAERIVAYREEHGPFTEIEDLLRVPGIGEAKLASIRDLVAVR